MTSQTPIRVLILTQYFLPAFRAGGPVPSLDYLSDDPRGFVLYSVVSSDRDLGTKLRLPRTEVNSWVAEGSRRVMRLGGNRIAIALRIARILRTEDFDVAYLNSIWSRLFSLWPIALSVTRLVPRRALVIAPRGELSSAALGEKRQGKGLLSRFVRMAYRHLNVSFHATAGHEAEDITTWISPHQATLACVPNIGAATRTQEGRQLVRGGDIPLRLLFVGRIAPIKNLDVALLAMHRADVKCSLKVVGPDDDLAYVAKCKAIAARLPDNVTVQFEGAHPHEKIAAWMAQADALLAPSRGENFGQAISEALAQGLPVITSSKTPWTSLLNEASLITPEPHDVDGFAAAIRRLNDLNAEGRQAIGGILLKAYEERRCRPAEVQSSMEQLFRVALTRRSPISTVTSPRRGV